MTLKTISCGYGKHNFEHVRRCRVSRHQLKLRNLSFLSFRSKWFEALWSLPAKGETHSHFYLRSNRDNSTFQPKISEFVQSRRRSVWNGLPLHYFIYARALTFRLEWLAKEVPYTMQELESPNEFSVRWHNFACFVQLHFCSVLAIRHCWNRGS